MKNFLYSSIVKIINISFIILPTPLNITLMWNFGSILGICLLIQIFSGLFLSIHYCPNIDHAFLRVVHIRQDVNWGWLIRRLHINGASIYFICIYIHIGRGLYYHSFKKTYVWQIGVLIFLLSMATAFLGYVLPWGQISFWGATVITNLVSAIPYLGECIVQWLWGGFSVNNATLNRFYSLHFLLPFIIIVFVILHLIILHLYRSGNPIGLERRKVIIPFHSYFSYKDIVGFLFLFIFLFYVSFQQRALFTDPDNYIIANSLITPLHIQPEWYFLFAYAILRSISSKLGGVIALLISILILIVLPLVNRIIRGNTFYPVGQIFFWGFVVVFILLTWGGARPIEYPYLQISQVLSFIYFLYFFLLFIIYELWDILIF